jgi:hypothetical protein
VSNVLNEQTKQQVIALGRLEWSLRRIQKTTGVRRETAAAYLREAGVAVRPPGLWGNWSAIGDLPVTATGADVGPPSAKPAIEVTTDFGVELATSPDSCEAQRSAAGYRWDHRRSSACRGHRGRCRTGPRKTAIGVTTDFGVATTTDAAPAAVSVGQCVCGAS